MKLCIKKNGSTVATIEAPSIDITEPNAVLFDAGGSSCGVFRPPPGFTMNLLIEVSTPVGDHKKPGEPGAQI
jgi:hypothetical protein